VNEVRKIMQSPVTTATPDSSACAVAAAMQANDVGIVPVCVGGRPVGVVTDRDIVLRLMTRTGAATDVPIGDIMSKPIVCCRADDSITHAAGIMGDHQIRRLVVCGDDGRIAGILSVGDIARDASETIAGEALGEIVELR
jgi:IMP dehydrogenase